MGQDCILVKMLSKICMEVIQKGNMKIDEILKKCASVNMYDQVCQDKG